MGFKKMVTLCCDGPCGLAVTDTEKTPAMWSKVTIQVREILTHGEKPHHKPMNGWFCPKCTGMLLAALSKGRFSLTEGKPEDKEAA